MLKRRKNFKINKKIDYRKKEYSNPFFRKKRRKAKLPRLSLKIKLIFLAIISMLCALAWFCFFSDYFNISVINASESGKISQNDIINLAWRQAENRRFIIGSQANLFLFNIDKLKKTLNEQYCFDELKIEKKAANTLNIEFKEKNYSAVWNESDKYYYIDNLGNIIVETSPLEIKNKNYPLIQSRGESLISNNKVKNQDKNINYIIKLFQELKKTEKLFKIENFIIDDEVNTVKITVIGGPKIYFNTDKDIDKQINKLIALITEKLKDDFLHKEYIDLRYGDRVYYR